jgi:hypothetical protein
MKLDLQTRLLRSLVVVLSKIQELLDSAIRNSKTVETGNQQNPSAPPNIEVRLPAEITEYYRAEQRDRPARGFWKLVTFWVQFGGAAIAFVLAWLNWGTLREIRQQTPAIRQSATAASDAAKAAQDAIKQARDQFRQDQRPYVWLTNDIGPFFRVSIGSGAVKAPADGKLAFNFHFTNYGKSPAIRVTARSRIVRGKDAETAFPAWKPLQTDSGSVLPPGKVDFNTAASDAAIEPSIVTKILAPGPYEPVVVHGIFHYNDLYGTEYTSEFCIGRGAGGNYYYCDGYNSVQ